MQLSFWRALGQGWSLRSRCRMGTVQGGKVAATIDGLMLLLRQYNGMTRMVSSRVLAGLLLFGLHSACVAEQNGYGTVINPPRPLPEVTLEDQFGQPFTWADRQGGPALLFFGFTHCPHICPTTLSLLKGVRDRLPVELAEQLEVWLVTVDPMRDSREILSAYLSNFGEGFNGARADLGELVPLFKAFGIGYAYRVDEAGGYDVDHTTSVFLLDPAGNLSHVYTAPHDPDGLLQSVRGRLQEFQK